MFLPAVILEDRLLQVEFWSRGSLLKCTMHGISAQKGSEVLKIKLISQPQNHVITGDCWSHGSQVHFAVLVTSAALMCANGFIFGSEPREKKTLKDHSTLALLRFSGVSEAAGLQLHRLRSMQCESAGNFNLGIICACSRWLHLVFSQVSFYCSTATSEQLALCSAQKEHRAKSCVKGTLGWPLHCQTSPEFFTKIVLICTLCILGGGLVFDWWLFPFTALVGIFGASLPCCHAPAWKICPVNLFCTLLPPLYFSEDTSHMWSCCAE